MWVGLDGRVLWTVTVTGVYKVTGMRQIGGGDWSWGGGAGEEDRLKKRKGSEDREEFFKIFTVSYFTKDPEEFFSALIAFEEQEAGQGCCSVLCFILLVQERDLPHSYAPQKLEHKGPHVKLLGHEREHHEHAERLLVNMQQLQSSPHLLPPFSFPHPPRLHTYHHHAHQPLPLCPTCCRCWRLWVMYPMEPGYTTSTEGRGGFMFIIIVGMCAEVGYSHMHQWELQSGRFSSGHQVMQEPPPSPPAFLPDSQTQPHCTQRHIQARKHTPSFS